MLDKWAGKFEELRQRAEEALKGKEGVSSELPGMDIIHLIHELEVHEVELCMQNEELLRLSKELEHSQREYADLYDSAPVAYLTVSDRGLITRANRTAAEMLGASLRELIKRGLSRFIHPQSQMAYMELINRLKKSEDTKESLEIRILRPDKYSFYAHMEVMALRDQDGGLQGWKIALADITGRKRLEEQLRVNMAELERSNRELQDFAFIASHDLKEPLRKVQSFGHMLERNYANDLDKEGNDYLARMIKAANRMQAMISGLLDYSRVAIKGLPFEAVNLNNLIADVLSDLELHIEKTGAVVEVSGLPIVKADPNQMRQLFQNLVLNALKFNSKDRKPLIRIYGHRAACEDLPLELVVAPGGEYCQFFVEDNGIGFDEKHLDRIFVLFERLHGHGKHPEGTGMGLAICKRIVERHGGKITARSTPEKGSTFIIALPCQEAARE